MDRKWKFGILKFGGDHGQTVDGKPIIEPVFFVEPEDSGRPCPTLEGRTEWLERRVQYQDLGGHAVRLSLADHR